MDQIFHYFSAFLIGFFGGLHCVGMCGGISAALGFAVDNNSRLSRFGLLLAYNAGRLLTYALMGALLGWLVHVSIHDQHLQHQTHRTIGIARIIAGLLLIAMGLYLAGWWFGLTKLEKFGGFLWRYLQPLSHKIFPVTTMNRAILLGLIWGWLPCGLVYTALVFSAAQATWLGSALTMFAFGLGTLPALLASGFFAEELKRFVKQQGLRQLIGILIITFGVWTIAGGMGWHIAY